MLEEQITGTREDEYLKRFEDEFARIRDEVNMYSDVLPRYKSENESLRERLRNIRTWVEDASKMRYLPSDITIDANNMPTEADAEAVLASLVTNILLETDNLDELKPTFQHEKIKTVSDTLYELLGKRNNIEIDEAFQGFDFYEDNPYKKAAEKKIAKLNKRHKYK